MQQLGQRAQGFHTQTFVERSRFQREGGRWLYGAWVGSRGCAVWLVQCSCMLQGGRDDVLLGVLH